MNLKKNLPLKIPLSTLPDVKLTPQINKVIYGDRVLLDLTNDTVTESSVLKGVTFHKADGLTSLGTYEPLDISVSTVTPETILEGYKAYNSNGELIIGTYTPPIPRYLVLDYIQSSGTQYIDTGYIETSKEAICTHINIGTSNGNYVYGGQQNSSNMSYNGIYKNSILEYNFAELSFTASNDIVMTQSINGSNNIIDINGTTWTKAVGTPLTTYTMKIFACNKNDGSVRYYTGNTKCYYFQIYNDQTLVRDYIPARQLSDFAIGLYDKVNNKFYANAGSGAFTAGTWTGEVIY